jgi:hypothetical protein
MKKSSTKKETTKKQKVGVIGTIGEVITNKGPVSKDQIMKVLEKRFPDHDPEKMRKTVNAQLPTRLAKTLKIKIKRNDDGLYFAK